VVHLFYGDSARDAFSRFNKRGKHIVFREALLAGPAALPSASWNEQRARFLADAYHANYEACLAKGTQFEEELRSLDESEELVCWFGRDLFCQIALIYVLVRLGEIRTSNISLVCPADTNEDVYCFGDVAPAEMNDLLHARVPLETIDFQHAAIAWHFYASDDPECLNAVFDGSIEVGSRFAEALEQHAARFPSTRDGLGVTERAILLSVHQEPAPFSEVFRQVSNRTRHITWGDEQIRNICEQLIHCEPPLLSVARDDGKPDVYALTPAGTSALEGADNRPSISRPAHWLGGYEASQGTLWSWDSDARRIVYSGT
jgi:hypothetical protein